MSILYWNVCGVGNNGTLSHLKYLIKQHQVKLLGLMEPKISGDKAEQKCHKLGFDGYHRVEAVGMSSGIWLLWQTQFYSIKVCQVQSQFIHVEVVDNNKGNWFLTIVYRNPNSKGGREFWSSVQNLASSILGPWMMVGDFNAIANNGESSRHGSYSWRRYCFTDWINKL